MLFYTFSLLGALADGPYFRLDRQLHWPGASLIWVAGLILLCYGLVRDVYLLRSCPCETEDAPKTRSSMLCVESLVGFSAVASGLGLHWLGWTKPVTFTLGAGLLLVALILAFGHKTRNWVLILAEVPDHHNVIPTFKLHTAAETQAMLSKAQKS